MFANINGTRIFFDVEGIGFVPEDLQLREKPVCFILHGGPGGDHSAYKTKLSPLSEWMQLVYIDQRGCGLSDRGPSSNYTLDNNVEDVEALRKHLGLEKIVLFGQSYGGMVALSYAVKYPEHLYGLLLITTSPSYRFIEGAKEFLKEKGTPEQQKMAQLIWNGEFESHEQLYEFSKVMSPLYSFKKASKQIFAKEPNQEYKSLHTNRSLEVLNEGFKKSLRFYDVIDGLHRIQSPTLVIGARHDWLTRVKESLAIADKVSTSELVVFEESSHSIMEDEYDLFISTLIDFVRRKVVNQ
jgi:proline iminopeptidase